MYGKRYYGRIRKYTKPRGMRMRYKKYKRPSYKYRKSFKRYR